MKSLRSLLKFASVSAYLQLVLVLSFIGVIFVVGPRPESALEAFDAFEKGMIYGLLKDEILVVTMLSLYFVTFLALYELLKNKFPIASKVVCGLTFIAVILTIGTHSAFSLYHLSEKYHTASDLIIRSQLIAAGESVIASNIWHSTSSYFMGIFMQGSGVWLSILLIKDGRFRKLTAWSGIIGNGFDLIQHIIHFAFPGLALVLLQIAGPFYFIWYFMLGYDFYKLSKEGVMNDQVIQSR